MIFRLLVRWEGTTQRTRVELSIMDWDFVFKIIVRAPHVVIDKRFSYVQQNSLFLPTLSTFLVIPQSDQGSDSNSSDTSSVLVDLTASSTFFLMWVLLNFIVRMLILGPSFIMVHGLLGTSIGFLQAVPLVKYYIRITLFGSTPRSVYSIKYCPRTSKWGTLFPSTTLLVVITFGYSIISPMINGFAFVTFFLLYMLYKYLFTWVNDHPPSSDTGGLFFPKAIQHVFVGLYVQHICLCALFFFGTKNKSNPEGALMIVLIVLTVGIVDIRILSFLANDGAKHFSTTLSTIPMARSSSSCLRHLQIYRIAAMLALSRGHLLQQMRHSLQHRALISPSLHLHLIPISSPKI